MLNFTIFTLYPQLFPGALGAGIIERARKKGVWDYNCVDIRQFAEDRHGSVDDTPAGGGPGMVMRCDILAKALDHTWFNRCPDRPVYCLSPSGAIFDQSVAKKWAAADEIALLCGRFEAIDQRLIEARPIVEISIGDFILAGGEVAAQAMMEASIRLLPGSTGNPESIIEESFEDGLLEAPQYTRPRIWEGQEIPSILQSGDHDKVKEWRRACALERTRTLRPDLATSTKNSSTVE